MRSVYYSNRKSVVKEVSIFQKGVALVEMAIIMPVIAIIMIGLTDCGIMLTHYLTLTQIASEGVRLGTHLNSLGNHNRGMTFTCKYTGNFCFSPPGGPVSGNTGASPEKLKPIAQRVVQLVNLEKFSFNNNFSVTVKQVKDPTKPGNSEITVSIKARYDSFFSVFKNAPVSTTVSGPYLL